MRIQHQNGKVAIVVGSGPNGLSASIELARNGWKVHLIEGNETVGGGLRSFELTLPGFIHDHCSAIHPLGVGSPFFRSLPLETFGLKWIHPDCPVAHPLDDGTAVRLERSIKETARGLGRDGPAYQRLLEPLVQRWSDLMRDVLGPLIRWPKNPFLLARFGIRALQSTVGLCRSSFRDERARALFAGLGSHAVLPLTEPGSSAYGLTLALLGHAVGWPMPRGGAQAFADALVKYLESLGGQVSTGWYVDGLDELPSSNVVLLNVTARKVGYQLRKHLPDGYTAKLNRFRYGAGVFKVDYALETPIPWRALDCLRAGTVHLGGTLEEITRAEQEVFDGKHPEYPFVLLVQHSLFDPTRAPDRKHTVWAYCHVPYGSNVDMTGRIERQIERFAPGFTGRILARATRTTADLEFENPNLIGGDINGGRGGLIQMVARPVLSVHPYRLPVPGVYLCSASTPPGGGVHGMCGYHAARTVIADFSA